MNSSTLDAGYSSDLSSDGEMDLNEFSSNFKAASDSNSDLCAVESKSEQVQLTKESLEDLENQINDGKEITVEAVNNLISVFHSCVTFNSKTKALYKYKVAEDLVDQTVNSVMKSMPKALERLLQPASKGKKSKQKNHQPPSSSCHWPQVKEHILLFLEDLIKIAVSLDSLTCSMLSYITQNFLPYFSSLHKARDQLIVNLVSIWSSSKTSPELKVAAFNCLNKLVRTNKKTLTERVMKECYYNIVTVMKSGPQNVHDQVEFMKASFARLCEIDVEKTYNFGFTCIKKLAQDYSVANEDKCKEARKKVYNWQFVTCIDLWCKVLSSSFLCRHPKLKPLRHPLFEVCKHTVNLVANSKYYPLRFHVLRSLIKMSEETKAYMPLPCFILHPLNLNSFKYEDSSSDKSNEQINIKCSLKLTQAQTGDKSCKLEILKEALELLLLWLNANHYSIAFPEMANPVVVRLESFAQECHVPQHCKVVSKLVEKVKEQIKFVTEERSKVTFRVTDQDGVRMWEQDMQNEGTPLSRYCNMVVKSKAGKKNLLVEMLDNDEDEVGNFELGFVEAMKSCVVDLEKVKKNKKAKKNKSGSKTDSTSAKKIKV